MGKDGNRSDPCYRSLFGNLRRREEVRSHFDAFRGTRLTAGCPFHLLKASGWDQGMNAAKWP